MSDTHMNDGGPAFPMGYHPEGNSADHQGMSLRDWFAGNTLAAVTAPLLEAARKENGSRDVALQVAAELAVDAADALLAALNKKTSP